MSAGAQFLLALILLQLLPPREFGIFSFLLVISQLSWGLWSALFCAPLPVIAYSDEPAASERLITAVFSTNLAGALAAMPLFGLLAWGFGAPAHGALLFGLYGGVGLLRWFARTYAYVTGKPTRTIASDLGYAIVLIVGAAGFYLSGRTSLTSAYGLLLLSATVGMLPFGAAFLKRQFIGTSTGAIAAYASVWKRHSGWSLLGVVSTEATANSHAYIVTALLGPAQFAPVAASTLLTRPIGVAMNALSEWERPRMAAAIAQGRMGDVRRAARHFRLALAAAWLGTAALAVAVLALAPRLIFPPQYDLRFVTQAAALWMLVALVRILRTPESTVLQASGEFRPLAVVTVYSAAVSIVAVVFMLWAGGLLWSIVGILIGEMLCGILIWRLYVRLWADEPRESEAVARS
jgi:O-antigen/teichoic acid export membrane protein